MPEQTRSITNTTAFPEFASKAAFLAAMEEARPTKDAMQDLLFRLSNTDTSDWADPTARHDD